MHKYEFGDLLAKDCPSRQVLLHMTSRWGLLVMLALSKGTHRFAELRRKVDGISERMLAQTLRNLEGHGLVARRDHHTVPPHVDYTLTPLGVEASERVVGLTEWIEVNLLRMVDQPVPEQENLARDETQV